MLTLIMSLFSSILIGLAPCNSNCVAIDQENTIEVKHKDNLLNQFGYFITTPFELLSTYEFTSSFASNVSNISTQGYVYNLPPYYKDNVYHLVWQQLDSQNPDNSVTNYGTLCTDMHMTLNLVSSNAYNRIQLWTFTFGFDSYTFDYNIGLTYDNSVSNPQFIGSVFIDNVASTSDPYYFIACRSTSYIASSLYASTDDYQEGYNVGMQIGYNTGFDEGYDSGVERGKEIASDPVSDIYQATYNAGKQVGDSEGYQRAISQGSTAATIFSGFVTVGLLPVNVLLTMFQYEVFGINIAGLVSGLFTIAIVVIIIRLVTGKKND